MAQEGPRALSQTAPIIVFTHRPLFDLKPEWEWFTRDGDAVMNTLAPYENVTALRPYPSARRASDWQREALRGPLAHLRVQRSGDQRKQKAAPVRQERSVQGPGNPARHVKGTENKPADLGVNDIVLTKAEFSGLSGMQQMIKDNNSIGGGSSNDSD